MFQKRSQLYFSLFRSLYFLSQYHHQVFLLVPDILPPTLRRLVWLLQSDETSVADTKDFSHHYGFLLNLLNMAVSTQ